MNSLTLSLWGVFLIVVALRGNAGALGAELKEDGGNFVPWLIALFVLVALYEIEATRKIVAPFATLLGASFLFQNWDSIESQFNEIYNRATGG